MNWRRAASRHMDLIISQVNDASQPHSDYVLIQIFPRQGSIMGFGHITCIMRTCLILSHAVYYLDSKRKISLDNYGERHGPRYHSGDIRSPHPSRANGAHSYT